MICRNLFVDFNEKRMIIVRACTLIGGVKWKTWRKMIASQPVKGESNLQLKEQKRIRNKSVS